MLQVKHLSKTYGAEHVLNNISLTINAGERVGLIGANGAGKSTLLRCIAGDEVADSGEIVLSPAGTTIGYLPQAMTNIAALTVGQAVAQAQHDLLEAERALTAAASALATSDATDQDLTGYDAALARFEVLGGYEREHRAAATLAGLGLAAIPDGQPVTTLSGGQKTRLGIAMLLLSEPDLLVLDEPTNHLDLDALRWLESFLHEFPGAVLLVSHDREFLDQTVTRILYLDPDTRAVRSYPGDYTAFAAAREQESRLQQETWVTQQKYVSQVGEDIARLKGEALAIELGTTPRQPGVRRLARKKAGLAKSREKKLQRFLDSEDRVERPRQSWSLKLDFGEPPAGGRSVLQLSDLGFAYPGQPALFEHLTLDLQYGERIALVGPNGAGKTTLLRVIEGALAPTTGEARIGANVRLGVLAQEQEQLDPERTVLQTALLERPMSETETRSFLHYFLFSGDDALRPVGHCSLGERTRLQLALLVLRSCNLLLLDEPLNHLDIEGREHFTAALNAFEGTVIAVSHDRAFLRAFPERLIEIAGGQTRIFTGTYADYEGAAVR